MARMHIMPQTLWTPAIQWSVAACVFAACMIVGYCLQIIVPLLTWLLDLAGIAKPWFGLEPETAFHIQCAQTIAWGITTCGVFVYVLKTRWTPLRLGAFGGLFLGSGIAAGLSAMFLARSFGI